MRHWFLAFFVLCAIGLLVPVPQTYARPADTLPPAPVFHSRSAALAATQEVTDTEELTGSVRIATALAEYFDRQLQEILDLRTQDWGFGCIAKAYFTAAMANVPVEQIRQMREQGLGWGEIRKSLGLPAGMPHQSLGQIMGHGNGNGKDPNWVPPGQAKKQEKSKGPKGKP